ncbi:complement factor I isoform X2 [Lampris incognitus]|uniref:complement factor I isoform X2 n=1 Tax=Lampris incognitus TaxID=2546036 RepID=UPI0024B5C61E|nr:complement factor I isoform X2 [Lampris incognitus]
MMKGPVCLLLASLISNTLMESPGESPGPSVMEQSQQTIQIKLPSNLLIPLTTSPIQRPNWMDDLYLGPAKCLEEKNTRASCNLVFCQPWERCVHGKCSCKLPYLCPRDGVEPVCGQDGRNYLSYCQVMSISCRTDRPLMSHFGTDCDGHTKFSSSIDPHTGVITLSVPDVRSAGGARGHEEKLLVCAELWDMAAANVVCREHRYPLGAESMSSIPFRDLNTTHSLLRQCVSVRCQGYEQSLAECVIYDKISSDDGDVAVATCYQAIEGAQCDDFKCVNSKCVSLNQTCDGVDDCGDLSDEMCCQKCRNNAFHCRTGVCVSREVIQDGVMNCLDGQDEATIQDEPKVTEIAGRRGLKNKEITGRHRLNNKEYISPKTEIKKNREQMESLHCGIPNMTLVDSEVAVPRERHRIRRVVGGVPAKPTQIQWQVAIEENKNIDCAGAYIGDCWVITAAHCVRPNPSAFSIKISLWKTIEAQDTTDIIPVERIHIHPRYNASNYENDIALMQLKKLPFSSRCFVENPAVSAVCVPWSPHIFNANHTCSISGWGRTAGGKSSNVLLWANVALIDNCEKFYQHRFKPGMTCAGDLDGSVDSCQGDSGGPLVCQDELGVSYLWGVVSWGERCGQPGFPGVYTQVAHYYEWIRLHTGWPSVTKYNS